MTMTTRFPSKAPGATITLEFDFSDQATAVTSPTLAISLHEGTDDAPLSLEQVGALTIAGAVVYARVTAGLDDVAYGLSCTANNGDDVLVIDAILPVQSRPLADSDPTVYLSREEFEQRFGLEEIEGLLADGNSYAQAERDAAGLIDGYLASRYTLPLASAPLMVKGWAADITRFKLWDERAPEEVRKRYEDALTQLKQVAQGVITLPPGTDGTKPSAGLVLAGYSNERVFTSETLCGY
jgi:phage gp36-like protein